MAAFHTAYFDASGTHEGRGREGILCVCGFVSTVALHSRLERSWQGVLSTYGVEVFHMTDFVSSGGEFAAGSRNQKWDSQRRREFIAALANIIEQTVDTTICCVLDLDSWAEIDSQFRLSEAFSNPLVFCGSSVVRQVQNWARAKGVRNRIEYVFEGGDAGRGDLEAYCADQLGVKLVFRAKQEAVPCRVADLIAWKTRDLFRSAKNKGRKLKVAEKESALASLDLVTVRPDYTTFTGRAELLDLCTAFSIGPRRQGDEGRCFR